MMKSNTHKQRSFLTTAVLAVLVLASTLGVRSADADDSKDSAVLEESLYDCPEKQRKGKYVVSLKPETTLDDLIKWAMTFHCKNFVYSSEIGKRSAKVTIMTPKNMSARQAWRVFLVGLQSMNLTVVPKGNILEIVETSKAKGQAIPIFTKGVAPATDQLVRVVLRPQHLSVDDLAKVLQELKSKNGQVTAIGKSGIVMVSDMGTNVAKMATLMMAVDEPVVGERLYMIKVHFADATELATRLTDILGTKESPTASKPSTKRKKGKGRKEITRSGPTSIGASEVQSAVPSKIIAEERINSLVVVGSEAAYMRVKALVKRLDVGIDVEGAGRIHVYRLNHSKAEEMSQTLTSVISGIQQPASGTAARGAKRTSKANRPTANAGSAAAFEGQVRVTHDQPTNSIVAVASVKDFLALRDVIRKLDIARPQVYIEANIVEIGVNNSMQYGSSWHGGKDVDILDGTLALGGVQHSELSSLNVNSIATSTGLIGGALGPLLDNAEQLLGTSIPSFGVLFSALANASNVNVLSSPHILTTDNEEAEISVGENIPFQSSVAVGGAGNPFAAATQSIDRQDIALTLKITPHINASSMVRLEIDLEISDVSSKDFGGLGPSWAKRTIKDTVVVRDQQAVVIGGLMSDKKISSESKVPLLGDIPVIGSLLFKYQTSSKEKRNLLVVLTPHIVHDQMDIERLVEKRTREQREFARTFSTFKHIKYRSDLDYRRKRGVLEEISRSVKSVEREAQVLRELNAQMIGEPDGEIRYFEEKSEGRATKTGDASSEGGE
ncbi:MAG: type II secretion system secretin GspD [Myxococcales bacterium]|nr:type II secretion system secretin GspD [Myxococcales bacterium]